MYILKFCRVFSFPDEVRKISNVVNHMLLKNIHIHSLNFLNFVYISVFDVETALENAKLAILERLELDIFFFPSHPWWVTETFSLRKIFKYLTKPKMSYMNISPPTQFLWPPNLAGW